MGAPHAAVIVAASLSGLTIALAVAFVVRPPRRLAPRVRPYGAAARTSLHRSVDVRAFARPEPPLSGGTFTRLFGPPLRSAVERISRRIDAGGEERLRLRLRQAGLLLDVPEEDRVQEYRVRQATSLCVGALAPTAVGLVVGLNAGLVVMVGVLGGVVGASRWPSRLNRSIDERCERMRVELYTINHLLAMTIRVGGGPIQAARRVVDRGSGEVVGELREALIAHASGLRASDAFERVAMLTPEPSVARTLRILASGAELGADLAESLRALSDDVREQRRDALRRQATRRRAAMLLPIVGILAPTMLLFVAAPIPSLIFGAR
jgi:tight adherence protein C